MKCTRCEVSGEGRYEVLDRNNGVIEVLCDECVVPWAHVEHEANEKAHKAREKNRDA